MSDITINNAHEESPLEEQVQVLRSELTSAQTALNETVDAHRGQRERLETAIRLRQEQNAIANAQVRGLQSLVERMQGTIGEVDQASKDDVYFLYTMRKVFAVARIKGNLSEARHVADEMGLDELFQEVLDDSQYEVPTREGEDTELTRWRAMRQVIEWQDFSMRNRHPMEGCYRDLWKQASRIAHEAGYCDEFKTIAGWFGIPTDFDFTYSGTIRVHVSGWFDVDVEGDTYGDGQPDAYSEIDNVDLSDYLDQMDINAEWREYTIED